MLLHSLVTAIHSCASCMETCMCKQTLYLPEIHCVGARATYGVYFSGSTTCVNDVVN